jgi:galactose oxidase
VLDGNATTIGIRRSLGSYPPLPHSITIDMHANKTVIGLSYLPRQDSILNGTSAASISVSTSGTSWGSPVVTGTWVNDQSIKFAVFAGVTARYVRLTALRIWQPWAVVICRGDQSHGAGSARQPG